MTETKEYPRWLYNKDAAMKRVDNAQQEKEAGDDWQCAPDGKPASKAKAKAEPEPEAGKAKAK